MNVTGTSFTPATPLDYGTYHIWVRGLNAAGAPGPWNGRLQLIIVPPPVSGAVQFTTTSGTTTDQTPQIKWDPVSGADHYEIWVNNATTGQENVIRDANVSGTEFTPSTPLSYGTWHIWARGLNAIGAHGPWSARLQLEIRAQ
jgi:predicted phage tail protein